ncbi:diacylglycerol kinase family lipid kinase [Enterococcus durans]|uniref:Diacylglycerol kinase family lipid kinase n=1 Tax=Enterococcus durans TaxID=53345 RepID=A0A5N0Z5P1_9ENTE|nr:MULTISPECIES: diacylglycerol kinase family protein [Enterococcus]KAA9179163.1 diacylglycerol kinase family lipid kinase [Enterococcus durans]KAA9187710.1 diacylglycerol kinase family lipid kinase [Enterococcus durans]KAA9188033.1 diacylglycerol kinase family lipid kinase [Enterococcus durans]KAA9193066.1 diacylglycerol kinase family lipid kinase [Enterococcus durans]KAA9193721.1 diacylglycerol kinase family lipid kinase [Enterococcus durans]
MQKALLVVNPSSGGEQAKEYEQLAHEKLKTMFDEVSVLHTKKAGDAKNFAREATIEGYNSVFVMGGDGTVNEGISGIAEQEHRPNFGFIPLGTVNDLARALEIPLEPEEAIENLSIDSFKSLDIGKINEDYFMNVVAIGTIPEAINDVDPEKKTKLGKLAYFISGIKQLAGTQSYSFHLTVDGQEEKIESSTLLVGLTNSIGGFETLIPDAKVDDGKLHLIYLKDSSLLDTLKTLPDLLKGVDESTDNLAYQACEKVEVSLSDNAELATNVDGDEGAKLPVKISILPAHLTVYC